MIETVALNIFGDCVAVCRTRLQNTIVVFMDFCFVRPNLGFAGRANGIPHFRQASTNARAVLGRVKQQR